MGLLDKLLRAQASSPEIESHVGTLVQAMVSEARATPMSDDAGSGPNGEAILELDPSAQIQALHACIAELNSVLRASYQLTDWNVLFPLQTLIRRLLQRKLPFAHADIIALLQACHAFGANGPVRSVVSTLERYLDEREPDQELARAMKRLQSKLSGSGNESDTRKQAQRIEKMLAGPDAPEFQLKVVDSWTAGMQSALECMAAENVSQWHSLLAHCNTATSPRPSKKWLKTAQKHFDGIATEDFRSTIMRVMEAVGQKGPDAVKIHSSWALGGFTKGDASLVSDQFSDCLRGLIWSSGLVEDEALLLALGDAAERCFRKVPGHGPLAPKVGNACLHVLAHAQFTSAAAQLTRLKSRVKHASSRSQVEKSLEIAAKRLGITNSELEELAVPICGLDAVGSLTRSVGEFTAKLEVNGLRSATLVWEKSDGKTQKTAPQPVKSDFPDELKKLKTVANELKKVLPAQASRLERLLILQRSIPVNVWTTRYLNHPLMGYLTRRLIWVFEDDGQEILGAWQDGALVNVDGQEIKPSKKASVRLWHPIDSPSGTVQQWRRWLNAHSVTQPFKQAHREIYVLTDAERETETYSNRFASHILRQHQFHALCRERAWQYTLQGHWDSHNTPFIDLPDSGYRVEFFVDPAGDGEEYLTESYVYLYVATDQVRFYRLQDDGPMRLEDVPPTVFTELMRDVDLFVGVCSVGNDPNWADGGPEGRHYDYWHDFAFGDLSESAVTRQEVLKDLLPKLKIAKRCTLEDRFLVVKGDIRSYRIHLGSGNVLMSPNDQYLCIVQGRSAKSNQQRLMLPFEGDGVLSTILSKAVLLADDKKIKDRSIKSQILQR